MASPDRQFKDAIYGQFARLGRAVAAPRRLELIDLLSQSPRTVEALAQQAGISVANASQHLQVLRAARLVEARKRGLYVEYRLADELVGGLFLALRELAEARLTEVEQARREQDNGRGATRDVELDEFVRQQQREAVVVLDVRPREEYRAAHIPGALCVPLEELIGVAVLQLPRDRELVVYCRGPYSTLASQAVDRLRERGFSARRLRIGVPEWRARGFRVE